MRRSNRRSSGCAGVGRLLLELADLLHETAADVDALAIDDLAERARNLVHDAALLFPLERCLVDGLGDLLSLHRCLLCLGVVSV